MIIEKIGTGKTLEAAITAAKALLNAPAQADVMTEVLETGSKGFLGLFGAKDYKVRAYYDDGKKEKKAPKKPAQKKQPAPKKDRRMQYFQTDQCPAVYRAFSRAA